MEESGRGWRIELRGALFVAKLLCMGGSAVQYGFEIGWIALTTVHALLLFAGAGAVSYWLVVRALRKPTSAVRSPFQDTLARTFSAAGRYYRSSLILDVAAAAYCTGPAWYKMWMGGSPGVPLLGVLFVGFFAWDLTAWFRLPAMARKGLFREIVGVGGPSSRRRPTAVRLGIGLYGLAAVSHFVFIGALLNWGSGWAGDRSLAAFSAVSLIIPAMELLWGYLLWKGYDGILRYLYMPPMVAFVCAMGATLGFLGPSIGVLVPGVLVALNLGIAGALRGIAARADVKSFCSSPGVTPFSNA